MKICYLHPRDRQRRPPARPEPLGAAWARAIGAEASTFEALARQAEGVGGRRESLGYDLVLVDLEASALASIVGAARLLGAPSSGKLVLLAAEPLPEEPAELERWCQALELSDLVLTPSYRRCVEIRQRTSTPVFELAAPGRVDTAQWAHGAVHERDAGAQELGERGRRLTVITVAGSSHLRLLREVGWLAYLSTRLGGGVRWLAADASPEARELALRRSAFVYLPAPLDDAGDLAADCARLGAILLAPLGYDPAKSSFPYTTFDASQPGRGGLLLLWLHASREFREFFRENARHGAVWLADENRRVQFHRRLQYQFPGECSREPRILLDEPSRALLDQMHHRHGPLDVPCEPDECLLVCLVRNGREHLPSFLTHYRSLGVRHFFFIDNGSDDGTLALLEAQPGVTTYSTALPHKHYERELRRLIIERHCRGAWCLNVDVDELFDYPGSGELDLRGLLAYLSEHRFTAMAGYLLDMYATENVFGAPGELDLRAAYPCYDVSDVQRASYYTHQVKAFCDHNVLSAEIPCYFGGIRKTLFGSRAGEDYLLTKHPLIFLDGELEPVTHPHYSNRARVADVTCVLYHYKFTPSFKAKVEESRASNRYVKFAQGQYERYQKQIGQSESLVIDTPGTRQLGSVDELVEQGFLRVSPAFEAHRQGASSNDARGQRRGRGEVTAAAPVSLRSTAVIICTLAALLLVAAPAAYGLLGGTPIGQALAGWLASSPLAPLVGGLSSGPFAAIGAWVDVAFSVFGLLALLVLGGAASHLLVGLFRRGRWLALGLAVGLIAAAVTPLGAALVAFVCGVVLVANALIYVHLASKAALRSVRPRAPRPAAPVSPLPRVCVIVPARDEAAVITDTLQALAAVDYPEGRLDIVVVDDGSVDDTSARVRACSARMPRRVELVTFEVGEGKACRLNQLLPELEAEYVLLLDADHLVDPDIVRRLLAHFAAGADIAGVQAASAVRNGHESVLSRALEMEYLFRCQGIYPGKPMGIFVGSGGMFRRSDLLAVGGFDASMLTEDVEISYRLFASGKRIVYDPSICTYDLAMVDFRNFFNQRYRWMRGLWQAMLRHLPGAQAGTPLRAASAYFVQFTSDGLVALCLSVLFMYVLLGQLGVVPQPARLPLNLMMLACSYAFSVGFVRARRSGLMWLLPIVPLYTVLHSIPMAWALIDGYVLGKPSVWVKTDRSLARSTSIRLSRGGA